MNKKLHEVNIEIDGIYCPQCKVLHPTLMWHEKYNDYLDKDTYIKECIISLKRFNINETDGELLKSYYDYLKAKGIELSQESHKCCICGCNTRFINKKTSHYVCSDECQYQDLNINE